MKNNRFLKATLFIFILIIIFVIAGALCNIYIFRFKISVPMQDIEYKKSIIKESGNLTYTLENLRPLVGKEELAEFIKKNDVSPNIYSIDRENIVNGGYRANFHIHTTNSDGAVPVEIRLNEAQKYAESVIKDDYFWIAITDHNTVNGAKDIIKILQNNPGKYKNIKIVAGMEIFTRDNSSKIAEEPIQQHVLLWCINPYDKYLNELFYKDLSNTKNKNNWKEPPMDFDWIILTMQKYGLVGIAHPARFSSKLGMKKEEYIKELFKKYANHCDGVKFTESYYQVYKFQDIVKEMGDELNPFLEFINNEAKSLNIYRTGSTDAHGITIFKH